MGASTLRLETNEKDDTLIYVDTDSLLESLSQIARSTTDPESIKRLLSSIRFRQVRQGSHTESTATRKRQSDETVEDRAGKGNSNKKSRGLNVDKQDNARAKWNRLVVTKLFECEECEQCFATEAVLKSHVDSNHASISNAANESKCPKYKCALCNKERTSIYNHYKSIHFLEDPAQVLFYNGNVLVHSSIDSKGGKAPWFLNEKQKAIERYDDVTCRLCEVEPSFANPQILADHYTLQHMVDPALLNNLECLFRAEKGAHLVGSQTSQTPTKCSQSDATKTKNTPNPRNENGNFRCMDCNKTYSNKGNLQRHIKTSHTSKKPETPNVFKCEACDQVFTTEALLTKHINEKHTRKTGDKNSPKSAKYKCAFCDKEFTSIYKHYGNVHNIEFPEQILFVDGNVLVFSDIDTEGGKATWFLSEAEKAKRYTAKTCRLCETVYDSPEMLEKHYRCGHMVVPSALKILPYLFRAKKGAHLAGLPASGTAGRRQRVNSFPPQNRLFSDSVKEPKIKCGSSKSTDELKNLKLRNEIGNQDANDFIMYQCKKCEVGTLTYDDSIEHAQLHHLDDYKQVILTCAVCKFAFEAESFANHSTIHNDVNGYKIVMYDPFELLTDDWFAIFKGLPETQTNRIKISSIYQHTRGLKMNSDVTSGKPLYQCAMCNLYVHPKEIEDHCKDKNACVNNKSQNHHCPECDIFFNTSVALTEHENDHTEGHGSDSFRKVTFNCKQDATINIALQKLQNKYQPTDPPVSRQGNRQPVQILENRVVSVFCDECKKSIIYSEFEAHAATHKRYHYVEVEDERDQSNEEDASQEQNSLDSPGKESRNEGIETMESNVGGTVEPWNSDNDSCHSLQVSSYTVQVQVHVERDIEEIQDYQGNLTNGKNDEENGDDNVIDNAMEIENTNSERNTILSNDSQNTLAIGSDAKETIAKDLTDNAVEIENTDQNINAVFSQQLQDAQGYIEFDEFSEEFANDLKRDLRNLGFEEMDVDTDNSNVPDKRRTTQELLEILQDDNTKETSANNERVQEHTGIQHDNDKLVVDNETEANTNTSQDIFTSESHVENNTNLEISQDIFGEATQSQEISDSVENNAIATNNNANENGIVTGIVTETTKETAANTNNETQDKDDEIQSNVRSSRDILTDMLPDSQSWESWDFGEALEEERRIEEELEKERIEEELEEERRIEEELEKERIEEELEEERRIVEETERQSLIYETQKLVDIMASRD